MSLLSLGNDGTAESYVAELILPSCYILNPISIPENEFAEIMSKVSTASLLLPT